uniref:Uncharacterized protein n=1 Tax=Plectus sambesii TaxID=2011161 RepID=A0A914WSJ8_9BILA
MCSSLRFFLLLLTLSLQCDDTSCFGQWLMVQPFHWRQRGWLSFPATSRMNSKPFMRRDIENSYQLDPLTDADNLRTILKGFDQIRKPRFG